jgi:hypothetical protein
MLNCVRDVVSADPTIAGIALRWTSKRRRRLQRPIAQVVGMTIFGKFVAHDSKLRLDGFNQGKLCSLDLDVHGGVSFSNQWPIETGPPSLTVRRVSASGTAASEISISTQKASM